MKRSISLIAGALLAVACATAAFAEGALANLSWSLSPVYTDGNAMPASDVASFTVSWVPKVGVPGVVAGSKSVAGGLLSTTVPVACGDVVFTVALTTTGTARYPNATSSQSNGAPYATGIVCGPIAPTLTVH